MIKISNGMKKIINKFKKITFVFLTILMLSLSLAPNAKAAVTTSWYNQSFEDWFLRVYTGNDSEIFGERYTAAQVQWIIYSIYSQMIGVGLSNNMEVATCIMSKPINIGECETAIQNGLRDLITYNNSSSVKTTLSTITSNPVSGIGYIKNTIKKFSITPEVKAQEGFGFTAAKPIQTLWKISRDISYGFLVIVIIAFAFMIMFKMKINPQTIITIQSALPKVVIAAILITFSYAIAGLLIDLMYVFLALIVAIIGTSQSGLFAYSFPEQISFILGRNIFEIFMGYWYGFIITTIATIGTANIVQGILLTLFAILAFFILIYISIKSIILLLKNYALILLTIATGPLEILAGTVSFSGGGFGSWLKKIASYLAVYPIVTVLILLAHFFLAQGMPDGLASIFENIDYNPLPFDPNFGVMNIQADESWNVPLTVGDQFGMKVVWIVVSYVLISLIPKVFDMIKSFMEKQSLDGVFKSAIGETVGVSRTIGQGAASAYVSVKEKARQVNLTTTGQQSPEGFLEKTLKTLRIVK